MNREPFDRAMGRDDLDKYEERYSTEEHDELRVASLAHDIVFLREQSRRNGSGRVIVTIAVPGYDLEIERLARYLAELGQRVQITEQHLETGHYLQVSPLPRRATDRSQAMSA